MMLSERGVTLLELILVMVIMVVLAGAASSMIVYEMDIYTRITSRTEVLQNCQRVVHLMSREIRQIMSPDSISYASADSLRFDNLNDDPISLNFTDNQVFRNGQPMVKSVDDFRFRYFDNFGDTLSNPVPNPEDIRTIVLSLETSINGQPFSVRAKVMPRNF